MRRVFVGHAEPWIGIPERFPVAGYESLGAWSEELMSSLAERFEPPRGNQRDALRELVEFIGASREALNASRVYVAIDKWAGPLYIAVLAVVDSKPGDGHTLESLAGVGDPEAVEAPILEPFETTSGIVGIRSVRYLNTDGSPSLTARADFVFPTPTGFAQLFSAQFDLVDFERMSGLMEELARTIDLVEESDELVTEAVAHE